jgi:DNA-binding beta-propeller fold protein YncE
MVEDQTEEGRLSRREFLKAGAAAGAFALLAGALPEVVWADDRLRLDLSHLGELINPFDVAVAPDGTVYVANAGRYGVVRLPAGGSPDFLGGAGTAQGKFNFPLGVDAAGDGALFVADTNNGRVQIFDSAGRYRRTVGRPGYLDGEFLRPKSVRAYRDGVLVADTRNHRIQYLDLKSVRLASDEPVTRAMLGGLGDGPGDLKLPRYVTSDAEGRIYVADAGHAVVKVFTAEGDVVGRWGEGEFVEPAGIAVGDGWVYVADAGAARVVVFDMEGRLRGTVGGLTALQGPRGLAWVEDVLLVADAKAARVFMTEV